MTCSMSWPCAALERADLSLRTTARVGGTAEWLLEPATPEELREAWSAAFERGRRPRILGGGANLIVADGLLNEVVISTERLRRVFRPTPDGELEGNPEEAFSDALPRVGHLERGDDPRLVVWAGASLLGLVRTTQDLGWSGFECMAGVPGSVGGAVVMNAGGKHGWMWDSVESVRVLTVDGELEDRARDACDPVYRDGRLGDVLVVGAVLRFQVDHKLAVRERVREYLTDKRRTQPLTEPSSGCIFKNPDPELSDGRSAGRLVDEAGCKGRRRGAAEVSELHGNFIVNRGGATALDVLGLIGEVRERVADHSGIRLEREVVVWGEAEVN